MGDGGTKLCTPGQLVHYGKMPGYSRAFAGRGLAALFPAFLLERAMASKLAASSSSDNEAAAPPAPSRSDSLPGVPKVSDEVKIKQMWQAEEALSVEVHSTA